MNHYLIDLNRDDKALWRVEESHLSMFTEQGSFIDVTYFMDSSYVTMSMLEPRLREYEWELVNKAKARVDLSTAPSAFCILSPEEF